MLSMLKHAGTKKHKANIMEMAKTTHPEFRHPLLQGLINTKVTNKYIINRKTKVLVNRKDITNKKNIDKVLINYNDYLDEDSPIYKTLNVVQIKKVIKYFIKLIDNSNVDITNIREDEEYDDYENMTSKASGSTTKDNIDTLKKLLNELVEFIYAHNQLVNRKLKKLILLMIYH